MSTQQTMSATPSIDWKQLKTRADYLTATNAVSRDIYACIEDHANFESNARTRFIKDMVRLLTISREFGAQPSPYLWAIYEKLLPTIRVNWVESLIDWVSLRPLNENYTLESFDDPARLSDPSAEPVKRKRVDTQPAIKREPLEDEELSALGADSDDEFSPPPENEEDDYEEEQEETPPPKKKIRLTTPGFRIGKPLLRHGEVIVNEPCQRCVEVYHLPMSSEECITSFSGHDACDMCSLHKVRCTLVTKIREERKVLKEQEKNEKQRMKKDKARARSVQARAKSEEARKKVAAKGRSKSQPAVRNAAKRGVSQERQSRPLSTSPPESTTAQPSAQPSAQASTSSLQYMLEASHREVETLKGALQQLCTRVSEDNQQLAHATKTIDRLEAENRSLVVSTQSLKRLLLETRESLGLHNGEDLLETQSTNSVEQHDDGVQSTKDHEDGDTFGFHAAIGRVYKDAPSEQDTNQPGPGTDDMDNYVTYPTDHPSESAPVSDAAYALRLTTQKALDDSRQSLFATFSQPSRTNSSHEEDDVPFKKARLGEQFATFSNRKSQPSFTTPGATHTTFNFQNQYRSPVFGSFRSNGADYPTLSSASAADTLDPTARNSPRLSLSKSGTTANQQSPRLATSATRGALDMHKANGMPSTAAQHTAQGEAPQHVTTTNGVWPWTLDPSLRMPALSTATVSDSPVGSAPAVNGSSRPFKSVAVSDDTATPTEPFVPASPPTEPIHDSTNGPVADPAFGQYTKTSVPALEKGPSIPPQPTLLAPTAAIDDLVKSPKKSSDPTPPLNGSPQPMPSVPTMAPDRSTLSIRPGDSMAESVESDADPILKKSTKPMESVFPQAVNDSPKPAQPLTHAISNSTKPPASVPVSVVDDFNRPTSSVLEDKDGTLQTPTLEETDRRSDPVVNGIQPTDSVPGLARTAGSSTPTVEETGWPSDSANDGIHSPTSVAGLPNTAEAPTHNNSSNLAASLVSAETVVQEEPLIDGGSSIAKLLPPLESTSEALHPASSVEPSSHTETLPGPEPDVPPVSNGGKVPAIPHMPDQVLEHANSAPGGLPHSQPGIISDLGDAPLSSPLSTPPTAPQQLPASTPGKRKSRSVEPSDRLLRQRTGSASPAVASASQSQPRSSSVERSKGAGRSKPGRRTLAPVMENE